MGLYYYAKANRMVKHAFSDDVAIVKAVNKKSALRKFQRYYSDTTTADIQRIKYSSLKDVVILTDY